MIIVFKASLFFFSIFTTFISLSSSLNSDGLSLLALKAAISTDPTNSLITWTDSDSTPCHWNGVSCNSDHTLTGIFLPNNTLSGYLPSELGAISSLRHLSLAGNHFSGPIPDNFATLESLTFLDLSSNLLNGSLLESLINLTNLSGTLNLSNNHFSGVIPATYGLFPSTVSLDLSHNNLTGKIPQVGSLLNRSPDSFTGNPFLCGFPSQTQCFDPEAQNPGKSKDPGSLSGSSSQEKDNSGSGSVTVTLISSVTVVIGVMFVSLWIYRKKWRSGEGKTEEMVEDEGQDGKFVVMDEGFGLELEDLLRATAYVVGKNRGGIVYKVVVGRSSGEVVAVRRLSEEDGGACSLKEFESEVGTIARVQHPNIVRLRGYYYATDEKLLVLDFVSNRSLYFALHGKDHIVNPLPPLSWAARLKIVQGVARGLAHIHNYSPRKYIHGNIKSSKILLNNDFQPFISGFGLKSLELATSSKSTSRKPIINSGQLTMYYVAPEARALTQKLTQKCDVYSFGIVLLEILTGRAPDGGPSNNEKDLEGIVRRAFREGRMLSEIIDPALLNEVHVKKQVVAAFHIALNCTEVDPEVRPKMRMVSDSLDRIKLN